MVDLSKCPECKNEFYSAEQKENLNCPFCGLVFSFDFGADNRVQERLHFDKDCELTNGQTSVVARTVDISRNGLGVVMVGATSFDRGESLSVTLMGLRIGYDAQVMWVTQQRDQVRLGLQLKYGAFGKEHHNVSCSV